MRLAKLCFLVSAVVMGPLGCGKAAKSALDAAGGTMTFTGTVSRAGTTTPIPGANVALIALVDPTAIQSLMEVRQVPDGKGGQGTRLRIKQDQVATYIAAHPPVTVVTDAKGKFTVQAPINVYLVYTTGPAAPTPAQAYGNHFWGINPTTGEIDKDDLIGVDLKLTQNNDLIQLPGGPVPPAAPPAATPQPQAVVVAPVAPASPPAVTAPEATIGETDLPRGNLIPAAATSTFWSSIKLTYKSGSIGTGEAMQADTVDLPDGQRYLELDAELVTAQTDPVYLVIQKGIDSTYVSGCDGIISAATVRAYPVAVNGTHVTYQLVPPGPYYKLFFAKKATQAKDGDMPTVDSPSDTLTVGKKDCTFAKPDRPFLATLTWDQQVDIDLYVSKYDAAKMQAALTPDDVGAALIDQANYTNREGTTLSLDVDNVYGYGPENNGDSAAELHPENYCYMVQVHFYAGTPQAVNCAVDVTYVVPNNGKTEVRQLISKVVLDNPGDWKTIGAYGPSQCGKLINPPPPANPTPADASPYPPPSSCVNPGGCDLTGDHAGQYVATVALNKPSYASSDLVTVTFASMPAVDGNWITIVPKSFPANSWCSWQWASGVSGTQVYSGLPAGDYEARLYYNWTGSSGSGGGQCEVIGKQEFTVTP